MTAQQKRNLVRARCVRRQALTLALQVAAQGWKVTDELVLDGLAMAWRDCERAMGVE